MLLHMTAVPHALWLETHMQLKIVIRKSSLLRMVVLLVFSICT